MDTHIANRAEIQVEEPDVVPTIPSHSLRSHASARRGASETVDRDGLPPEAAGLAPPPRDGSGLVTTACVAAVLVAAGGVFWISPYNHASIADVRRAFFRLQDAAEATLPGADMSPPVPAPTSASVAPAAALARAPAPSRAEPLVEAAAATGGDDMAKFLNFRSQETVAPAPPAPKPRTLQAVKATATSQPPVVATQAAVIPAAPPSSQARPVVAAAPQGANPEIKTTEVVKPASAPIVPADPVAVIAALRAAPMTEPQQVQVLEVLTQLGTVVHDQRAEIAQLRLDQQHAGQRMDGDLADFRRRVALAEARAAVGAAMATPVGTASAAANPSGATRPIASPAPSDTGSHRYHVQAASPGLAMLSELDPSGGEQRQLPVSLGDPVPGWGKVVSIFQRGASWAVKTEHGLIQ